MNNKSPAFQFYPGDFLSDENVISMTFEERGIYITLLCSCWIQGSIPADPEKLNRLLPGYSNESGIPSQVLECFTEMEGDSKRLVHPRLDKERQKQADFKDVKSESGKRGAQKRWENHQKKPSNSSAIVLPMAKNSSSSLSSSSSSSLNLNTHRVRDNFEEDWNRYPRKAGNKVKARICYHKTVGKDPDKRKEFLAKMQLYVENTDLEYLKHGETFFQNWKALVVDTVKSRKNGNKELTPMDQAMASKGDFVDKVLDRADAIFSANEGLGRSQAAEFTIEELPEAEKEAAHLILYNYSWIDNPPPGVQLEPT